ncbi:hypothetical protein [Rubritalea marina]|uniref:hypothetical protein n=1 Tax=Rubritalea marina TaxID=361055 RepID=UPI000369AB93|nr:hypothetical protein [Rubritalea marina]
MRDIAKAIAVAAIWLSAAIIIAFGLCDMNDTGASWVFYTLTIVILSFAYSISLMIWNSK